MKDAFFILLVILVAVAALTTLRIVRAEKLATRAVSFDVLTSVMICGFFVTAALTGDGLFLEIAMVLGLLGFLTAVTVARFIERTGK